MNARELLDQYVKRYPMNRAARDLEAALRAVLDIHGVWLTDGRYCQHDGYDWPCPTVRAITTELAKED